MSKSVRQMFTIVRY